MNLLDSYLTNFHVDVPAKLGSDESEATVACLSRLMEARDPITHAHSKRVSDLAFLVSGGMHLSVSRCVEIAKATLLHDIGKLALPLEIISKPTGLTLAETTLVRSQCVLGEAILSGTGHPVLDLAAEISVQHHERFSGGGYPRGLSGEEISLPSRIVNLCDVYDALRRDRPYRPGLDHTGAMRVIIAGDERTSPDQFDPDVLRQFFLMNSRIEERYQKPTDAEHPFM